MPYKLKTSARRSRRNRKIGIVAGVALLAVIIGVVAFYVFVQSNVPLAQYGLLVNVGGSGSTNATGTQTYNAGSQVAIQATANADWVLNEWLLNGTSVGSRNPYVMTVSQNQNLTAVFTELPHQDTVLLQTSMGNITIQLRDDKPNTAGNFKKLVQEGKYDGTIFHRVVAEFMIQGGHIDGVSSIPDEIGSNNSNVRGAVTMANAGPNTAASDFFINTVDNSGTHRYAGFDTSYTVFGSVIQGMDVVDAISQVPVDDPNSDSPKPLQDVTIIRAILLP